MPSVYLDYNATSPLTAEARQAMLPYFEGLTGNPSSMHGPGQAARAVVERARGEVGALVGAAAEEVIFVSGGSEADNLALRGVMQAARRRGRGRHLLVSAVEHPAVLRTAEALAQEGFDLEVVPVDRDGRVEPREVGGRLRPDTVLVSIMLANNEVGTLQPVAEIGRLLVGTGCLLHVDAVQAAAHLPIDRAALGADLLSLSAHKMGGPQGIGALVVGPGVELQTQITGGAQQSRRRAGTESPALCVGFAAAAARLRCGAWARGSELRDRLEREIGSRVSLAVPLASAAARLPNTSCIIFAGMRADEMVLALDLEGIQVSWGAACASGMARPSHVLSAMGVPAEQARAAVRFSLGEHTTAGEIDRAVEAVQRVVARQRCGQTRPVRGAAVAQEAQRP